ncbi:MAG TPA: bifunctional diguanylate cyclase/phosphodiesterase, partial [Mycobacteriales bacterium]|nr:bifunctional diguanylate cyclase/phosphodiesterase [Mycobacteriales bacterium]
LGGRTQRIALVGLLAVVIGLASLAIVSTRSASRETQKATDAASIASLYQDARFYATRALALFDQYRIDRDKTVGDAADSVVAKLQHTFELLSRIPTQATTSAGLARRATAIVAMANESDALAASGRPAAATRADQRADAAARLAIGDLSRLEADAHRDSQEGLVEIRGAATRLGYATPIVLGGVVFMALWVCLVLVRDRRRMTSLATTDPLTGLPNRLGLANLVTRTLPADTDDPGARSCALLLLDLDRFKEINDALGHEYGDDLLVEVAGRLRKATDAVGTAARIGGDEFVVVLDSAGADAAEAAATGIRSALCTPFTIDNIELSLDVSIGIAIADSRAPELHTPSALLRAADLAMYAAKEQGGGHVRYTAELGMRVSEKVTIVGQVRRAVDRDELVLHYQPQVSLDDDRLVGVEALLRWDHPVRGMIPPAEFLPAVEDHQLIDRITHVVLTKALRQSKAWQEQGMRIPISVNVATRALLNASFAKEVADLLAEYDVDASLLCIEVTETTVMRDSARCAGTLNALHDLGIRLSVDDYGTGYASMAYLKNLPLDELKIDRSFVARMTTEEQQRILTESVIELGHNLGLSVVAEGVEDADVCQALHAFGCDVVQGFLYSRPVPPEEILAWSTSGITPVPVMVPAQRAGIEDVEPAR